MSSFKRRMSGSNFKFLITFILLAILSLAIVFAFVKIDKNETDKTIGTNFFTYSIGLLDEEGEYKQGTSSIYMKDYETVDGLTVEIKDKATITYKLFFFDKDKNFVDKTSELSASNSTFTVPATAEYFKLMITPTNDAEVSLFEINTYASQLTVKVNK